MPKFFKRRKTKGVKTTKNPDNIFLGANTNLGGEDVNLKKWIQAQLDRDNLNHPHDYQLSLSGMGDVVVTTPDPANYWFFEEWAAGAFINSIRFTVLEPPTGADILIKIYSRDPLGVDTPIGDGIVADGEMYGKTDVSGGQYFDRIWFEVTQVGSGNPGKALQAAIEVRFR